MALCGIYYINNGQVYSFITWINSLEFTPGTTTLRHLINTRHKLHWKWYWTQLNLNHYFRHKENIGDIHTMHWGVGELSVTQTFCSFIELL
jgi:hypothetical protein